MSNVEYVGLNRIEPNEFLSILNKESTRAHLIGHEMFDSNSVNEWIQSKIAVDSSQGCRVRAILVDKELAGWCGIQFEEGNYEIAIVLDDNYWGLGRSVFREIMLWAKEFNHTTILIHFLHSRRNYKFLQKIAKKVYESELLGNKFTTYEIGVD